MITLPRFERRILLYVGSDRHVSVPFQPLMC